MTCAVARCGSQLCPDQSRQEHNRELNDVSPENDDRLELQYGGALGVLSKNPIDAVRRADSTLDARRVATFVTAESLC